MRHLTVTIRTWMIHMTLRLITIHVYQVSLQSLKRLRSYRPSKPKCDLWRWPVTLTTRMWMFRMTLRLITLHMCTKFHYNPSSGCQVIVWTNVNGQTDGHSKCLTSSFLPIKDHVLFHQKQSSIVSLSALAIIYHFTGNFRPWPKINSEGSQGSNIHEHPDQGLKLNVHPDINIYLMLWASNKSAFNKYKSDQG